MSRKAPKLAPAAHPLPQTGGSFIVEAGALVPAQSPDSGGESPSAAAGVPAKPVSKEA